MATTINSPSSFRYAPPIERRRRHRLRAARAARTARSCIERAPVPTRWVPRAAAPFSLLGRSPVRAVFGRRISRHEAVYAFLGRSPARALFGRPWRHEAAD